MNFPRLLLQTLLVVLAIRVAADNPRVGFFIPDSIKEVTMRFKTFRNLIVLPVIINDSVSVNLILDTGCKNLVLFGKRFQRLLNVQNQRPVVFSGLGSGIPVSGNLAIDNRVSIHEVLGERVPVVVVEDRNMFKLYRDIHGVIGYDLFLKFEIEIDPADQTITFRPATAGSPPPGYAQVPLEVVASKPMMSADIRFNTQSNTGCKLIIDTGSALGLLLKTTDVEKFSFGPPEQVIGRGLNGPLSGFAVTAQRLNLNGFEMYSLPTSVVRSDWQHEASIGMDILKNYRVVINYVKAYACFQKL